jgi:hypothetical protein
VLQEKSKKRREILQIHLTSSREANWFAGREFHLSNDHVSSDKFAGGKHISWHTNVKHFPDQFPSG